MGKYQAYPEYKGSQLPWLGAVPAHWTVCKLKHGAEFQVGWTPPTGRDENFVGENLWANISDIRQKVVSDTAKRISDAAAAAASMSITPAGSLLYSFKLSVGAVAFAGRDMYTNEAIASFLKTEKVSLDYLYYALPKFVIENASVNIYGAAILNQELIKNAPLVIPTPVEQGKISAFLDHETAKIDRLIARQERLIELLKEKRQAVISHAVTKGLNPNASMKDSGVESLGEVPAHWEVSRIGYIGVVGNGSTPSRDNQDYWCDGEIPWLNSSKVNDDVVVDAGQFVTPLAVLERHLPLVPVDSVLIAITGEGKTRGMAALLKIKATISQHLSYIKITSSKVSAQFLHLYMKAQYEHLRYESSAGGATKAAITCEFLKKYGVVVPPSDEQEEIVQFVYDRLDKLDELSRKAESSIALMQEHRTALISAAVTGKIDVRGWQSPNTEPQEAATAASA